MANQVEIGDPPITIAVKRSARARRYSLRISSVDGGVSLTVPQRANLDDALDFARTKEAWLRGHLDLKPDTVTVGIGACVPIEGQMVTVATGQGRKTIRSGDVLQVPVRGAPRRVKAYLQTLARDRLSNASDRYAARLGRSFSKITLRDTRSRWGSCTSEGALMYSWRLVMAPPSVLDYVAAHEIAHLVEMNHAPAFWSVVESLYPDHRSARSWLREEGPALHRYRFDG
ncbi:MAG: SprT family zinc-dependent metalloprotease [Pseudomonadota bacterium]